MVNDIFTDMVSLPCPLSTYLSEKNKMDLGMIILGAIMAIVCALPFMAVTISRNRVTKNVKKRLNELAAENNGSLTRMEVHGKMALAMDEKAQRLFFVKQHTDQVEKVVVDLSRMSQCRLEKQSRTVTSDRGKYLLIESVLLRLVPNTRTEEVKVTVFDIETDLSLNGELQFAERWAGIIDEHLRLRIPVHEQPADTTPKRRYKASA